MAYEIIYVCHSINNKNIREGELNILEKHEEQLCFHFGTDEMNIKKRFYNDIETLNKDFDALLKLKKTQDKTVKIETQISETINIPEQEPKEIIKKEIRKEPKKTQKEDKLDKYKIIKRKK